MSILWGSSSFLKAFWFAARLLMEPIVKLHSILFVWKQQKQRVMRFVLFGILECLLVTRCCTPFQYTSCEFEPKNKKKTIKYFISHVIVARVQRYLWGVYSSRNYLSWTMKQKKKTPTRITTATITTTKRKTMNKKTRCVSFNDMKSARKVLSY